MSSGTINAYVNNDYDYLYKRQIHNIQNHADDYIYNTDVDEVFVLKRRCFAASSMDDYSHSFVIL
ncbi:MAG: hypothetical protein OXC48_11435 [Endozoicomonadaceae bacterium]|nr:hypothetical protein [Endozoicomonadaceae bacterium]